MRSGKNGSIIVCLAIGFLVAGTSPVFAQWAETISVATGQKANITREAFRENALVTVNGRGARIRNLRRLESGQTKVLSAQLGDHGRLSLAFYKNEKGREAVIGDLFLGSEAFSLRADGTLAVKPPMTGCSLASTHRNEGPLLPAEPVPVGDETADPGNLVDVLVVYTSQARLAAGGTAAMEALIQLALAETNQAYETSQIAPRLRLVHAAEVDYQESGDFSTELNRLTNASDGFMDEVQELRDLYHADVVSLFVNSLQHCGTAWLMTEEDQGFADQAYNVVSQWCATGYYSLGHELGHLFGAAHDPENADGAVAPYAYGFRDPTETWRDIMAYAPGDRIQLFSNPNVIPANVTEPSRAGTEFQNVAQAINNTARTVANFRTSADQADLCVVDSYGVGSLSSIGSVPAIRFAGLPTIDGDFSLLISGGIPLDRGLLFYGDHPIENILPWGTVYAGGAIVRQQTFFFDENGQASLPVSFTGAELGTQRSYQVWVKDVGIPAGARLSNGLTLRVCL